MATLSISVGWRELQWSMSWLRPGGKLKSTYPNFIIQIWDLILVRYKTPGSVTTCQAIFKTKIFKRREISMAKTVATSEKIRIRVKAYEPSSLDQSAAKIVDTAKKTEQKFQDLFHYQQKRR